MSASPHARSSSEENKRIRNEKKDTGRSPAEVELQPKTRDRKALNKRNSWADIYNENTTLRKHKRLLGQEVETDDGLEWRVKWGQRGSAVFALLLLICHISSSGSIELLRTFVMIFGVLVSACFFLIYYKNISLAIVKRLLREVNVVVIISLTIFNWVIDMSFQPLMGLIYLLCVNSYIFTDALKLKSRVFVIIIGSLHVMVNAFNIYGCTFEEWHRGDILLKYTIQGNTYTIMTRATKRSIFIQIMIFSISGVYTMFNDKKKRLMLFATEHIYLETGTASKEVEDKE